ncbi:MAG: nitrite reductase [Candidatus Hydrogenedentota bacterium]|nr:MAG: nitrite reductase [Candidatus Hydrogenedentota bacterium]
MPNKVEELKQQKDGLDVLADIMRAAEVGFEKMDREFIDLFKWYGLYQQRPKDGYFMMRIKIPNGDLLANQIRAVGEIANEFARGLVDITTRQNYQLHWVRIEDVPEIFRRLHRVGLLTVGACGDVTRNVVGCPVAGIDASEYCDASPLVKKVSTYLTGNRDFSNLPRKFKISISGCRLRCAQPDINDIGVYGTERITNGKHEVGFGLMVGGGLSTKPYFAADLGVFLRFEEVFEVVRAIAEIFRDSDVLRQDRGRARLKFLIHDPKIGVGPDRFREMIEEKIGYQLERFTPPPPPPDAEDDHLGITPQKQEGLYYVGVGVTVGRTNGDALIRLADIADEFSTQATIRNTNKQNFIITHVPESRLSALCDHLKVNGFDYRPSIFKRFLVSCTGIEFCNLAITETKELARRIAGQLEERFPGASRKVRIHFSGCPNNCGQNSIADIGLRGGLTKVNGQSVEAYDILLGGGIGSQRAFAEAVAKKIPSSVIGQAIGDLYEAYLAWAQNGETFQQFVRAHAPQQLEEIARRCVSSLSENSPAQ